MPKNRTRKSAGRPAWRLAAKDYADGRSRRHGAGISIQSRYVTVRDGTRLAVDICLPGDGASGQAYPTILLFTPYYRRFRLKRPYPPTAQDAPDCGPLRDFFVPYGYAVVVVDVRGTGASFGTRLTFRSPEERLDAWDVADWIVAQAWCDGNIGSTGISYVGAAADFLATTGHPAVRAVMPMFSVWDTYANHFYPGGVYMSKVMRDYGKMLTALDLDDRPAVASYYFFSEPYLDGPAPVDCDSHGSLLAAAIAEHVGNFEMADLMPQLQYRDQGLKQDRAVTSADMSPSTHSHLIASDLAHYGVSGWMDGAGYSEGAAVRYRSIPCTSKRLLLGPWDHGARAYAGPSKTSELDRSLLMHEALRFFDFHLMGLDNGLDHESPVHYYTFVEEVWKEAGTWPPDTTRDWELALASESRLVERPDWEPASEDYRVDFGCGTGKSTRHERIGCQAVSEYYTDWHGRDSSMLAFRSSPVRSDIEVTGHVLLRLWMSCSEPDAALFAYIEDESPDGTTQYMTEGKLRLRNRRTASSPINYRTVGPYHTHANAVAEGMPSGRTELVELSLLPISWLLRMGHRLRLAIAGADRDHYEIFPAGRPPVFRIRLGSACASILIVPVV